MQPPAAVLYFSGNHRVLKSVTQLVVENISIDLFPEDVDILNSKLKSCVPDILVFSVSDNHDWKSFFKRIFIDCTLVAINSSQKLTNSDLFDFGVDVVFSRDVSEATLLKWLHRKLFQINSFNQLSLDAELAVQTANIAMTNAGELGRVIHFIEKTFDLHNGSELAQGIFNLTQTAELKASVLFRWSNGDSETFSCEKSTCEKSACEKSACEKSTGEHSSNEKSSYGASHIPEEDHDILTNYKDQGRILDFGNRTLFNYPMVSLFVKDMPLDDEERYGRVKDLIPIALGAINEKLMTLDQERTMYENASETISAFEQLKNTISMLAQTQNENSTKAIFELTAMKDQIFYQLPGMELEDDQEKYIESVLQEALDKVAESFHDSTETTASLMLTVEDVKGLNQKLAYIAQTFAPKALETVEVESG